MPHGSKRLPLPAKGEWKKEKFLEFNWYECVTVHKVYLSAILDLCDRRIVAYVVGERNDNPLVFSTLEKAIHANPDAPVVSQ